MKGKLQLILVIIFIVGSIALSKMLESTYTVNSGDVNSERVLSVQTEKISSQSHQLTFRTTGTVEARDVVQIISEVSGRIVSVNQTFFTGGSFSQNDILFEIEPKNFELEVQKSMADVARAKTSVALEEAEAKASLEQWNQINSGVKPPDLIARLPQLEETNANLKSAKAQLKIAKLNLERSKFKLPFTGRVLQSNVAVGQYIVAGQSYGDIFNVDSLEISASLNEKQLEWLERTDKPEIIIETKYMGEIYKDQGELLRGASSIDSSTRFAGLRFSFLSPNRNLIPGVFSAVEISGPTIDQVMLLPAASFQTQGIVWLIENNKLVKWEPEVIYQHKNYVAVKGKPSSVEVVVSRVSGASDGMSAESSLNNNGK